MNEQHLLQQLIEAGWTQAALAERLFTTPQSVSRWVNNEREPSGPAKALIREVALEAGLLEEPAVRSSIPIMGYVGAGGEVDPDYEQVPPDGLEQVELSEAAAALVAAIGEPIGFRVRGGSMYPRFNDGDVLVVDNSRPWSIDNLIGEEAVVRIDTEDGGKRLVKTIRPGSLRFCYNLESIDRAYATMENARIVWASPVDVIVRRSALSRIAPAGRQVRPAAGERPRRPPG